MPPLGTPQPTAAHLALAHEVSDVGPQGGATSTQVLFGRGHPAPTGPAGVEVPQEALHGGGGGRRLPHPWSCCC